MTALLDQLSPSLRQLTLIRHADASRAPLPPAIDIGIVLPKRNRHACSHPVRRQPNRLLQQINIRVLLGSSNSI